jgi:hypothetical protein
MTGNEPESTGSDQLDEQGEEARRRQHGTMRDAEDDAAHEVGEERARNADAGDTQAQAEQADKPDRLRHAAEWLDGKLVPRFGAGDIGPYDEESEESVQSHDACPLCGHPMGEHTIDRSHPNAVLNCPVPPIPEKQSFEPLNEVGMVKRNPEE